MTITGIPCRLDVAKGSDQTQFFGKPPEGKQQVSLLICLEHPLSRGTVHITSSDPLKPPQIDPGYFRNEVDAKILAAGVRWMDQVAKHPLVAKSLAERELPPEESRALDTEEGRIDYVKNHISTQYHLTGTAALGEVVDSRCKVKGVENLRVIDASIFPTHVSGNIMSSKFLLHVDCPVHWLTDIVGTYAVGEKGADLIKEDRLRKQEVGGLA